MRFLLPALLVSLGLALAGCHRSREKEPLAESGPVKATWYNVPADSLAKRRAGKAELTAASDHYKIGTLLRVTRVATAGK